MREDEEEIRSMNLFADGLMHDGDILKSVTEIQEEQAQKE